MPGDRPFLARRPQLWELVAFDSAVAAAMTVAHLTFLDIVDAQPSYSGPLWFGWVVAILSAAPLAVRRLWPVPSYVVVLTFSFAANVVNALREPWIPAVCILYTLCVLNRRPVPALAAGLAASAAASLINGLSTQSWRDPVGYFLFVAAIMLAGWTMGRAVQARRDYASRLVNDERLRIARELHDIMAHSMSLIAVKAGIANHVADQRPEEARDALRIIEATSRATLNDMRRMLGVLRSETADLAPAPSLRNLPELVERAQAAGVDVTLDVTAAEIPEALGLSVYRIVQEALTNVVKHAGPVTCTVRVVVEDGEVRVDVTDTGPGGTPGTGHGLVGMRERVTMYGGSFAAGPRPEGGFAVSARMPVS
ncbi:histidine kinase [Actinocrispum sp. NPDC049592]|uniref:sensor histidine kinase n=1 Tax=Actinocrispum sp. NPDC049592 TaxID=3154835 RepID=UPI0034244C27